MEQKDTIKASSDYLLYRWARWVRNGNSVPELGYPRCSAEQKTPGASVPSERSDDEVAVHIDSLIKNMPAEYQTIARMHYISGFSLHKIHCILGVSRPGVIVMVSVVRGLIYSTTV